MNLKATDDNVILKPVMSKGVTAGGVVLPGGKTFEDGAVVTSIGPDVERLVVGDVVVRPDPPRMSVIDDETNEVFLICAEVDILAWILPEKSDDDDAPEEAEDEGKEVEDQPEGEVYINWIPKSSLDAMQSLRQVEGLSASNRD